MQPVPSPVAAARLAQARDDCSRIARPCGPPSLATSTVSSPLSVRMDRGTRTNYLWLIPCGATSHRATMRAETSQQGTRQGAALLHAATWQRGEGARQPASWPFRPARSLPAGRSAQFTISSRSPATVAPAPSDGNRLAVRQEVSQGQGQCPARGVGTIHDLFTIARYSRASASPGHPSSPSPKGQPRGRARFTQREWWSWSTRSSAFSSSACASC